MKKAHTSTKPTPKDSDVKKAVGGQPENDQDAREAGLASATAAHGQEDTSRRVPRPKTDKRT